MKRNERGGILVSDVLDIAGRALLFTEARSHNAWTDKPVDEALLREVYDLARLGATSANCSPMRLVFVASAEGKRRLKPSLSSGNLEKTMQAPVTAIVAHSLDFADSLPKLFPHTDARPWFTGNDALIYETAFRNGSLQGAYLMLAARACGLDCGPMSGFDKEAVDKEFFPDGRVETNFLCNLGYGDPAGLFQRLPRLDFDEACEIV